MREEWISYIHYFCVAIDLISKRPDGNVPFADIDSTPMSRFADFVLKDEDGFYELNLA